MRVDLFDFELPEDRIALRPAEPRDAARMLVVRPGEPLEDRIVRDLPDLLRPGDVLVLNDTKVIPSRLHGLRVREGNAAKVEIMLHKRDGADRWRAFARPAKKLTVGDRIRFGEAAESTACELVRLDAEVEDRGEGGEVSLRFSFGGPYLDEAVARLGEMPLPPYIAGKRATDERDLRDYQTCSRATRAPWRRRQRACTSPTRLLAALTERGVDRQFVTLHVGAGTFLPVKAEDTRRAPHACRMGRGFGGDRARAQRARAPRRAHRRRRHHLAAPAGDGGREAGACRAPSRARPRIFITPGLPLQGRRSADDQLPPAALDPVHAGRGLRGLERMRAAYAHAIARGLPLLFLRRCLPASSGAGRDERTVRDSRFMATRRRGPARPISTPRGAIDTPAFMPVGTAGTVKAHDPDRCKAPAPRSCSATPIT